MRMDPNWITAIAEAVSAFVTAVGIIVLVWQNIREAKQHKESTIRSEWYILDAERQRLKPDEKLSEATDRYEAILKQMHKLYDKYPDILSNWPAPPETFEHLVEKEPRSSR